jgi:hypothetical protein
VPFCTINGRGVRFIAQRKKFFQKNFPGKKPGPEISPARLPNPLFLCVFLIFPHIPLDNPGFFYIIV